MKEIVNPILPAKKVSTGYIVALVAAAVIGSAWAAFLPGLSRVDAHDESGKSSVSQGLGSCTTPVTKGAVKSATTAKHVVTRSHTHTNTTTNTNNGANATVGNALVAVPVAVNDSFKDLVDVNALNNLNVPVLSNNNVLNGSNVLSNILNGSPIEATVDLLNGLL